MNLKLKEIVWEITNSCSNNCSYCTSANKPRSRNETVDNVIKIAKEIAKYPPEEITISGGDPLVHINSTHEKVTKILKEAGINVKIILNPKSINNTNISILGYYDGVGISVNTKEDLLLLKKIEHSVDKKTIITNFNLLNVFNFKEFEDNFAKDEIWQIQYTVYPDLEDNRALYNNEEATRYLFKQIHKSRKSGNNIIISDNMNNNMCTAGVHSLGILSDGDIIPCLAQLSWENPEEVEGNISKTSLKDIWENGFKDIRFNNTWIPCKSICKNKYLGKYKLVNKQESNGNNYESRPVVIDPIVVDPNTYIRKRIPQEPIIIMYAAFNNDTSIKSDYTLEYNNSLGVRYEI